MFTKRTLIVAALPLFLSAPWGAAASAETTGTTQSSTTFQSMEQQFIGQLVAAELQTFFQQVDTYVANSLSSKLGGVASTQPAADDQDFGEKLSQAMLQTFIEQLDSFIAQLPTLLLNSVNLFGQTSQSTTDL